LPRAQSSKPATARACCLAARQQSGCCPHGAIDAPPQRVRPHAGAAGIGSERQKAVLGQYVVVSKGTFSELELSILRQRSQEALRVKAARGDLHTTVAIGYRRGADDRLEQDPDLRIREALSLVFRKFGEIGSVRQLALWLRQEHIDLPIVAHGPQGRVVRWSPPRYN